MNAVWPPPPGGGVAADADRPDAPEPTWGTTPGRWVLISLFWLPLSLFWGAMLGQVLPTRVEAFADKGHTGTYLGLISISGALVGLLVQIVIGPISDACTSRWGRRRPFIIAGTLLSIAALLGFAYAQSFAGLVLAFAAIQLFLNIANGPYQALIPDLVPLSRQGGASGVMGFMSLLGDAGGPLLAGLLLRHAATPLRQAHAIQHLIWIIVGLLLVCLAVTALTVPDRPLDSHSGRTGKRVADALHAVYMFEVRRYPGFYRLLASRAVYNLGFYTAIGFLAYYVEYALHQGVNYQGALTELQEMSIGGALLGTFPAAYLADRTSKKRVIAGSTLFSVVAGVAFALTPSLEFALKMAFLFGIAFGMFRAVDWAFACNLLPPGGGAKFMAIWSLSTMIPQLAAPGFGPVADGLNHLYGLGIGYRAAMCAVPLYALLGLALLARVPEKPL